MRTYCSECQYPLVRCVCACAHPVATQTQIDILQHPSESQHAKNTARLVTLCCPNARIWVGEHEDDFVDLRASLKEGTRSCALLYPSAEARTISEYHRSDVKPVFEDAEGGRRPTYEGLRLLFLDGTWKKAFKLFKLNAWLEYYPQLQLDAPTSAYRIRKCSVVGGLSTLECVVQSLAVIEPEVDTRPLLDCFEHLQRGFGPQSAD